MTSDIFIYDQIGGDSLFGKPVTLKDVQEQLNNKADSAIVHINSPGGDVREGFAIHDFLSSSGKKITTIIEGKCYSIATVVLLAGKDREMQGNAELMIHNPWGMAQGDADELEKYAEWIRENEEKLAAFYVEKTGLELSEIESMMQETTFMDADKAISKNFVTKKVEPMKAVALITNKMTDFTDDQKSTLRTFFEPLEKMFKAKAHEPPKNIMVKVEDGSQIFIESEDDTLVGKKAFQVSEGERTEDAVTDGNYTLEDGRVITVAGGTVTMVEEAPKDNEEVENLKAKIAELEAEKVTADAKAEETETELTAEKEKVTEVQASFNELKTKVFGKEPPKKHIKEPKIVGALEAQLQAWGEDLIKNNR